MGKMVQMIFYSLMQMEIMYPLHHDLRDYNDDAKGNKYTGQDQITDQKFIINKIKILNHRWIIADYSDGEYWGEAMIKYFLNDDGTISYETFQSVLYQK